MSKGKAGVFLDNKHYELDATEYGVDVFLNGVYLHTLEAESYSPPHIWLIKGLQWVGKHHSKNKG
jgi:hypothetical protein